MPWYLLLIAGLIIIDQLVKHWVTVNIALNMTKSFIPGIMDLTNLHNDGAAWSMLEGKQWFLTVVTIIAIVVVAYLMGRYRKNRGAMVGLSLVMSGAIGNFIDRLAQGYVVDMFELLPINFPVFNVADSCLTIGVLILLIVILKEED